MHNFPRLQTILQGYSNQGSVVLAKKKKKEKERHGDEWNTVESPEINKDT